LTIYCDELYNLISEKLNHPRGWDGKPNKPVVFTSLI
jgi:hypothetical protein